MLLQQCYALFCVLLQHKTRNKILSDEKEKYIGRTKLNGDNYTTFVNEKNERYAHF